jgi:predicted transposase YbfD/YdcC
MLWLQFEKTADGMIFGQNNPTLPRTIPMAYDRDATVLSMDPASILGHFALLPDPRREHGQIHRLDEIVFMAICGVLCGADSWQEIADYGESKLDWLSSFLTLPGGVPSHDTFRRVFCLLDPVAFQTCFFDWMSSLMARHGLTPVPLGQPGLRPVAIDGKTQRGSARRTVGRSPRHMVGAWAVENHLSLGQVATDAKSNEITAIPELLKLLDLEGAVVTIDAMGCQKDIATGIVQKKGEYVLAVKENQPHLHEDIGRAFDKALEDGELGVDFTICQTEEIRSGRQETRTCCVITNPSGLRNLGLWTKLTAICMVTSERVVNGVPGYEVRYFIGSVAGTAEEYLRWVRGHWGIENSLHWVLDVCFREDDQRHWAGHSAANLSWLRKLALWLLKAEPTSQAKSSNRRRHLAGWKNDYLLRILAQIPQKSGA